MSAGPKIQAVYSIAELAEVANITTPRMRRMLIACGVEMFRAGRQWVVPLDEVRTRVPALFRNLVVVAELSKRGETVKST